MRSMHLWLSALLLLLAAPAAAVPIVAPPSAFDGSETLIDFEGLAGDVLITNQFADVAFSGGLFADTSAGPGFLGSGVTASNFQGGTLPSFDVIDIVFSGPMDRLRFDAITNSADNIDVLVTSVGGGSTLLSFNTSLTPSSVAIQDTAGILSIQLQIVGGGNHAMALDNFQFAAVPEPATAFLMSLGLLGLCVWPGRKTPAAAH